MKEEKVNILEIEERLNNLKKEKESLEKQASQIKNGYFTAYSIRPAGRHVLTIGEDLIQDKIAAIIELVKNAYDADSNDVIISFIHKNKGDLLEIRISDHGNGMSTRDVIEKWMVPSTRYKAEERKSPKGRIMQGRKGIGRYAVSTLGNKFELETVDEKGEKTTLNIDWNDFKKYEYLDQVEIPIHSEMTKASSGTILKAYSDIEHEQYWNEDNFKKLRFELKKLIPPQKEDVVDNNFKITLSLNGVFGDTNKKLVEEMEPYPILELFDYRISGTVESDGKATLSYRNNKIKNGETITIQREFSQTNCGKLIFDIRVYDRDKDSIELLIKRGLKDSGTGKYLGKLQARQLLDSVNGIGVYRNGFRIRPLGDVDYDWLKLNEKRVQNPSMKIGSNQVIGYVYVESEENSGLEEKSARDGLKDNIAYSRLKEITVEIIKELETRRFAFRRKMGMSSASKKTEQELEKLYDYSALIKSVSKSLVNAGVSQTKINGIIQLIEKEQEEKNTTVVEIKKIIAIYQGQATLGKIVNIILHEGRRPLNYFKNQVPNLRYYVEKFTKTHESSSAEKIIDLGASIGNSAEAFVNLFGRLDPLAARRRSTKEEFTLLEVLNNTIGIFSHELEINNIIVDIQCEPTIKFYGWKQDLIVVFSNLFDNSIYWIKEKNMKKRDITISVLVEDGLLIDYRDSGPGIDAELLESGIIFEPEFTTKSEGTGLGLAIAGEAANRNGLSLVALQNEHGAYFRIQSENGDNNDI